MSDHFGYTRYGFTVYHPERDKFLKIGNQTSEMLGYPKDSNILPITWTDIVSHVWSDYKSIGVALFTKTCFDLFLYDKSETKIIISSTQKENWVAIPVSLDPVEMVGWQIDLKNNVRLGEVIHGYA